MKGSSGYNSPVDDLFCEGQAGMLGILCHDPKLQKTEEFMLLQRSTKHHGSGCKDNFDVCNGNIIMRFEVSKDMKSVSNRTDIVNDIQYKPFESDHPFGGPGAHNGNRLGSVLMDIYGQLLVIVTKVTSHNTQLF